MIEPLLARIGGTEYARKVWVVASYLLFFLVLVDVAGAWSRMLALLLVSFTMAFCAGLFVSVTWEHPLGGVLCLISGPLVAWAWTNSGVGSFRYYLGSGAQIPEYSSLALQLLASSVDLQVGLVFTAYSVGFYYLYRYDDHRWMSFARRFSTVAGVTVLLSLTVLTVGTGGRFSFVSLWVALVFLAIVVARGPGSLKKHAERLSRIIGV